jgi:hypothetical protein
MDKKLLVGVVELPFVTATCDMKRLLTSILLLVPILGFALKAGADDRWETLRAINWVENPTNHSRAGRFGELGPYQFRAGTWRMHTKKPFRLATQRETADEVAIKHYEWIKENLERAGVDANPFNIAMAWNTGVGNVVNGRVPSVSYDYAERVTNLVQTFKRTASQAAVAVAAAPAVKVAPVQRPVIGMVHFAVMPDAPRFEIVVPPPAPDPVVYTDREPVAFRAPTLFVVTTATTLAPTFTLLPSLTK